MQVLRTEAADKSGDYKLKNARILSPGHEALDLTKTEFDQALLETQDNQKPEAARFVVVREDQDGDLAGLFGAEHGLDSYAAKRRYALSDEAFATPAAYVGIYDLDV